MGRLTQRLNGEAWFNGKDGKMYSDSQGRYFGEAAEKLAHYEDLEEQGRLIEQKYGRWIHKDDFIGKYLMCSECSHVTSRKSNYCPNCGAKMDEVE